MKIVASNSLTVSNVSDGTITHTAYANSTDGTDGFTTVYPNFNLLDGTKDFKPNGAGNNTPNQNAGVIYFTQNKTVADLFKAGDYITISHDVEFLNTELYGNSDEAYIQIMINGGNWSGLSQVKAKNMSGKFYTRDSFKSPEYVENPTHKVTVSRTIQLTQDFITANATANSVRLLYFHIPVGATTKPTNLKIEKAKKLNSTATPWMPSASEATTADYPSYFGQYTDFTQADSTNPSDYTWSLMRGNDGERGKQIFKSNYESVPHNTGHYWSDLSPAPSIDNPPKIGDTVITPSGNILQIDTVNVGGGGGGGTFGVGDVLGNIKGPSGSDGTSGIIVSSVAPASPQNGQLWQDTSTTPQLVKKWTGSSWVIWELYAQNLKADSLSALSANLGDINGGTLKLIDDEWVINGQPKMYGIYQSKFGLLSSGPTFSRSAIVSDTQMGVASLTKGGMRFIVTDYTEDLKNLQESGMNDQNYASIKFNSYENGKDIMTIESSGDIVFKGNTSQDTPWVTLSSGVKYKFMFSRMYISVDVVGDGNSFMQFGTLPQNLRPISDQFMIIANQGAGTADDRHIMVRASDGAVILWTPKSGITYRGEVSYTL